MTPGLGIGIGIDFVVLIFFILGGGHAPQNEKNKANEAAEAAA